MEVLRTPDWRFSGLPDWPFAQHYADVDGLRLAYVDEGPSGAPLVLACIVTRSPTIARFAPTTASVTSSHSTVSMGIAIVTPDADASASSDTA